MSAALNEFYEESGFQISRTLKVLGYRHDTKIDALYFYMLINKDDIREITKNTALPEVAQFFPFDYGFVPVTKKADMDGEIAQLDKASQDFKENSKKIEKKYKVKVLFPRQRVTLTATLEQTLS